MHFLQATVTKARIYGPKGSGFGSMFSPSDGLHSSPMPVVAFLLCVDNSPDHGFERKREYPCIVVWDGGAVLVGNVLVDLRSGEVKNPSRSPTLSGWLDGAWEVLRWISVMHSPVRPPRLPPPSPLGNGSPPSREGGIIRREGKPHEPFPLVSFPPANRFEVALRRTRTVPARRQFDWAGREADPDA
eukprot:scaffold684_cov345-Pavlova_lutheri.AAC.3